MKPFDLEAAKRGEPIQTRSGEPRRFLLHDPLLNETMRVIAATKNGRIVAHYESGNYYRSFPSSENDLFMAPRKRQMWARAYRWGKNKDVDIYRTYIKTGVILDEAPACGDWLGPAVLVAEWDCDDSSPEIEK